MISSNHAVMQNEAIYGLFLVCTGLDDSNKMKFYELLIEANIGKNLTFVINKYYEKMDKPTVENLLSLFELLSNSSAIDKHLKTIEVDVALRKLLNNKSACNLEKKITKVADNIQKNG